MRIFSKSTIVVAALAAVATTAQANDRWVTIGGASKDDGGGTSLAVGWKTPSGLGFQIGAVFNGEFEGDKALDYPVPHSNFTNLGVKRTGATLGADVLYFFQGSEKVAPFVEGGLYFSPRAEIARSNATGWYYKQSSKSEFIPAIGLGIQLKLENSLILGVGYHSVRGANLTIGKSF